MLFLEQLAYNKEEHKMDLSSNHFISNVIIDVQHFAFSKQQKEKKLEII